MPRTKKQSTEAAVREIRRRTRRKFSPALDPSPVIPSDLSFGYLSAELKSPVKIPIPTQLELLIRRSARRSQSTPNAKTPRPEGRGAA